MTNRFPTIHRALASVCVLASALLSASEVESQGLGSPVAAVYCTTNTAQACARISLVTAAAGSATEVTLSVSNLQGVGINGVTPAAWARISGVDLLANANAGFVGGSLDGQLHITKLGAVTEYGDSPITWLVSPITDATSYTGYSVFTDIDQFGADILGCTRPPTAAAPFYQTCDAATGSPGAVVFRFRTAGSWTASQVGVVINVRDPEGDTACEIPGTLWDSADIPNCVTPGVTAPPAQVAQTLSFTTALPASGSVGQALTVIAAATSGLPVTMSSATPTICTLSVTTVTLIAAGTCSIAADQSGDAAFLPAPQITTSAVVGQLTQALAFTNNLPATGTVGSTYTLTAVGGASGNPVVFSSATPATCGVSGAILTLAAAGPCTAAADQAGNATYAAATQARVTLTVVRAAQTLTFASAPPSLAFVGQSLTLSAVATSGLPATLSSQSVNTCSVSGTTVSLIAAGTCVVAADQAGSASFAPAVQITASFAVSKAAQRLAFSPPLPSTGSVGATISLSATGGLSGNAIIFSSVTPGTCSVTTNTLTLLAVGICTVAADQAGNDAYLPASQMRASVSVTAATRTFVFRKFLLPLLNLPATTPWLRGLPALIRFNIGGNMGTDILSAPLSSARIACDGSGVESDGQLAVPVRGTQLAYSAITRSYEFLWQTDRAWGETCRQFHLRLSDGSEHVVRFKFF